MTSVNVGQNDSHDQHSERESFYVDGCDCVEEAHPGDHQAWLRKVYKNCMPCIELHDRLVRLGLDEEELEDPAFKQAGPTERILALLDEAEATLPRDELASRIMTIADEAFAALTSANLTVNGEARE